MHDKLLCDDIFAKILKPNFSGDHHQLSISLNAISKFKSQETGVGPLNNQRLRKGDIIKEYYLKQKELMGKANNG